MEDFTPEAVWTVDRDQFFQGGIATVVGLPIAFGDLRALARLPFQRGQLFATEEGFAPYVFSTCCDLGDEIDEAIMVVDVSGSEFLSLIEPHEIPVDLNRYLCGQQKRLREGENPKPFERRIIHADYSYLDKFIPPRTVSIIHERKRALF